MSKKVQMYRRRVGMWARWIALGAALVGVIATIGHQSVARASGAHTVNAALCVPVGPVLATDATNLDYQYQSGGRADNTRATSRDWFCPIDNNDSGGGTSSNGGDVRYIDNSASNVTCHITGMSMSGSSYTTSTDASNSGVADTTIHTLNLNSVMLNRNDLKGVFCTMPPLAGGEASRIYAYTLIWT